MKRLFIAINLPISAKARIREAVEKLEKIFPNERFVSYENWHLTVSFLGYQPDEVIIPILEAMKETSADFPAPEIKLEKIILAPPDKKEKRMIWLSGSAETSKSLGEIKDKLEEKLIENKVSFRLENRQFNSHLTLSRFQEPFRDSGNIALPDFRPVVFIPESLDLMESHLKRSGAEYELLSKFDFSDLT